MEDYKKIIEQMIADNAISQEVIEKYCPEFKENRDEKIRKALIAVLKSDFETDATIYDISVGEIIKWIEKLSKGKLVNSIEAEKEKADFVGNGFIECRADFLDFKEGSTYWLEYIGDDKYNVRSDNLLGKTYHITPCQLYMMFKKQTQFEEQGEVSDKIVERARTEKQRVLVTESNGVANIDWNTRSLQDAKLLMEYGLNYIKKKLEKQGEQPTNEEMKELLRTEYEKGRADVIAEMQKCEGTNKECLKGIKRVQEYQDLSNWEKKFDNIASMYAHNKNQEGYNNSQYVKERSAAMLYHAKKELKRQDEQKLTDKVEPLQIKKGNWYVCIKDYQFCEHDYLTFEKGKIYKSVKDGEITAEDGGNWPFSDAKDYFRVASQEEINSIIKSTDKTEPKFKIGDWIMFYEGDPFYGGNPFKILKIEAEVNGILNYLLIDQNGHNSFYNKKYVDENARLWTIDDARDGNVLSNGEIIVIFKHFENPSDRQLIIAYIGLDTIGNIQVVDDIWNLGVDKAKPATKEQRDKLEKAMTDAGYTFDFEKKKLKEIHVIDEDKAEMDDCFTKMMNGEKVSLIWSDDDERMLKDTIALIEIIENSRKIPDGFGDVKSWLEAFKDKVQLQQSHQEWNEEDEKIYSRIYDLIHDAAFANYDVDEDGKELGEYAKITNWFKALKDRVQSQSYDPYKAVVESIAEMCQHYDRKDVMSLQDFYDNVKVKCKDAKEYESLFPQHS